MKFLRLLLTVALAGSALAYASAPRAADGTVWNRTTAAGVAAISPNPFNTLARQAQAQAQANAQAKPQAKPGQDQDQGATKGSPKHIFFIIPAYNVEYLKNVKPMSSHEKLQEWEDGAYDPIGLAAGATEALLEHSKKDGFCGYGSGMESYGKCYGSALLDSTWSSFMGDYLFPVWFHQDPRYFRLGEGSFATRAWYSFTRSFITRTDKGTWTFASGSLLGTAIAAATSNLYYPKQDRGLGLTMSRVGWDLGGTVIFNLEAEYWPDIKPWILRIF